MKPSNGQMKSLILLMAPCPIEMLIEHSLSIVRTKDPSWEKFQPHQFKKSVVESWKSKIRANTWNDCHIEWALKLKDFQVSIISPMFKKPDFTYNPYS